MKKIVLVLGALMVLTACGKDKQTVCEVKQDDAMSYTFTINSKENDVTYMKESIVITKKPNIAQADFNSATKQMSDALEEQKELLFAQAGGTIPGHEMIIKRDDQRFEYTKIQDFAKIDFDLMNRINFYSGYYRKVEGLYYDEEVKALEANGFTCTVK